MIELPDHPHFIGCQFHPEFKSKPLEPHPLFRSFIGAAYEHGLKRRADKAAAEIEMFHRPEKVGEDKRQHRVVAARPLWSSVSAVVLEEMSTSFQLDNVRIGSGNLFL